MVAVMTREVITPEVLGERLSGVIDTLKEHRGEVKEQSAAVATQLGALTTQLTAMLIEIHDLSNKTAGNEAALGQMALQVSKLERVVYSHVNDHATLPEIADLREIVAGTAENLSSHITEVAQRRQARQSRDEGEHSVWAAQWKVLATGVGFGGTAVGLVLGVLALLGKL